jgi:hypothetical protein
MEFVVIVVQLLVGSPYSHSRLIEHTREIKMDCSLFIKLSVKKKGVLEENYRFRRYVAIAEAYRCTCSNSDGGTTLIGVLGLSRI